MSRLDATLRSAGFRASTGLGRVVHRFPALERHLFGQVDPFHLRRWDHIRTVPALWNVDAMDRLDVPWWTWSAIREMERFLDQRPAARAFEWGSGASTFWLARRCGSVTSVEHHQGFADHTAQMMTRFETVEVLVRQPETITSNYADAVRSGKSGNEGLDFRRYVDAIEEVDMAEYDVIVIDGRARSDCLARAVDHIADGAWIVLDNSDRHRYQDAIRSFERHGEVRRHRGWGPGSPVPWETAILTAR
jgi:predicted O-methyltransferase YrrM